MIKFKRNMNKRDNRSDNTRRPDGQMEGNPEIDVQDSTINAGQEAQISDVEPMDGGDGDVSELEALKGLLDEKEKEVEKEKKEYLFLMAEFDNFRKRTLRERSDLIKSASEKALKGLLPIVDDFERGLDAIKDTNDAEAVKEGMNLIYNKLIKYLADNGVKEMVSTGVDFDADIHEAVAMVPAADEAEKGKVKDTVSKGYMINDKVLRHANVVVAQ